MLMEELTGGNEYFIYVGALHARKNIDRMLRAFNQFKEETQSATKFIIVGEKLWSRHLTKSEIENLKHAKDIIFIGHLPIDRLTKIVGGAKALVLVSYFEGFGIPLVEAMRAGTAIICGNRTALPEVVGDAAILVDPYSISDIAYGLQKMDENEELRESLVQSGLSRSHNFSWDDSAEIIWEVIADILKKV